MNNLCDACGKRRGTCLCSPNKIRRAQALIEDQKRELRGHDYVTRPVHELMQAPDYSPHAMRVIAAILQMNTKQLEQLTIARGPING